MSKHVEAARAYTKSVLAGEIFVALAQPATVTHDEHSLIDLPAGNYRITRQREYSPEAIRNVAD